MPSPSDSSRSLTSRPSTRGLTHLRLHRPWLQALLTLGLAQVLLGILVVTFSMVASSVTTTESIKRSCPSWAGFSVSWVHSCWVGAAPRAPTLHPSCRFKSWPLLPLRALSLRKGLGAPCGEGLTQVPPLPG